MAPVTSPGDSDKESPTELSGTPSEGAWPARHSCAGYPGGAAAPSLGTSRLAIWSLGASLGGWVSVFGFLCGLRILLFVADPAAMVGVVLGIVALIRIKQRSQNGVAAAIVGVAAGAAILVFTVFMVVLAWANFAQIDEQYRYKH
jgi:hypothetical protein